MVMDGNKNRGVEIYSGHYLVIVKMDLTGKCNKYIKTRYCGSSKDYNKRK